MVKPAHIFLGKCVFVLLKLFQGFFLHEFPYKKIEMTMIYITLSIFSSE